tara:strand:+ start:149 stop:532 length:384 start_codon:yes stop_codon:yes gene_type:complete
MKKILVPLFSLMMSFNAYGEQQVVTEIQGHTYYVDFDSIKVNGNVFYWRLRDYLKPDEWGDMSSSLLHELDCKTPHKERMLSAFFYTQPMGKGSPSTVVNETKEWSYSPSDTARGIIMDAVCVYTRQ